MKSVSLGRFWLVVVLAVFLVAPLRADDYSGPENPAAPVSTQAAQLAAQVRSLAASHSMSRSKKEQWISSAVRVAVVAGTAYQSDPAQALAVGIRLSSAAARAAPEYAEVIAKSAAFAPTMKRISGSVGQIRAATLAAARGRSGRQIAVAAAEQVETSSPEPQPQPRRRSTVARDVPDTVPPGDEVVSPRSGASYAGDAVTDGGVTPVPRSKVSLGSNAAFHVSLDTSTSLNDNVYLTTTKTSAAIVSATPGVQAGFGEHSIAKGGIAVRESFTHYTNGAAPNSALASVSGQVGYEGAIVSTSANGSFQQLNQNSPDYVVASNGTSQRQLLRTNASALSAQIQSAITAKTGARAGVDYTRTDFKNANLIGNRTLSFPAAVYFKPDPKLSLFTGATYGTTTPTGTGPKSKDMYYNVGASGEFSEKLTGNFSVGYRTRKADLIKNAATVANDSEKESMLGFNGSFDYKVTEKTAASIYLSRNFGSSAFGQSTKGNTYGVSVKANFTPQFSASAAVGYRDTRYGAIVFTDLATANQNAIPRHDNGWENSISFSYAFNTWLTAVANYSFRNNRSSYDDPATLVHAPNYNNNVFTVTLGMQY